MEAFVEVPTHQPTVVRAFKLDGSPRDDDLKSAQRSQADHFTLHYIICYPKIVQVPIIHRRSLY